MKHLLYSLVGILLLAGCKEDKYNAVSYTHLTLPTT